MIILCMQHLYSVVEYLNFIDCSDKKFPGVDVMITIFCDFCQFSSIFFENIGVFSKTNVLIKFLQKLALD
jgi:hypothetical protein